MPFGVSLFLVILVEKDITEVNKPEHTCFRFIAWQGSISHKCKKNESEDMRMRKGKMKHYLAMMLAVVMAVSALLPANSLITQAANEDTVEMPKADELKLYDAEERTDLDADEVVTAEDLVIAEAYGFDVKADFEGIEFESEKVSVSYDKSMSNFDGSKAGSYDVYYKVEPASGKRAYLIHRTITVKEVQDKNSSASGADKKDAGSDDEEDGEPKQSSEEVVDLDEKKVSGLSIKLSSNAVMQAAAATAGTKLNVSYSGYAKYCGHSMGIKYISTNGDYKNHLVYCMNMNRNTTNGNVEISGSSKVKPQVTYCLVNGARKLNGTCNNSKYSVNSAAADYFITNATIHVINGEVKLSYYNDGSNVYKKIAAFVADAKNYDKNVYTTNGLTKSVSYSLSPKVSEWTKVTEDLYKSKNRFVRTKSGNITDVKYTITGAPSGLTVGEIKTDAQNIDNAEDLKKYDICVAQTDASQTSSNFWIYCNAKALAKIQKENATIKVRAQAYANEKGGRKWTPTVVSQQKITFLEEFTNVRSDDASVKVTSSYETGTFSLHKSNSFSKVPVAEAVYYLYEDAECTDLLCKLEQTNDSGLTTSEKLVLTQKKYYLKEVLAPTGYEEDEKVYEIPLSSFTLYDANGKVTQRASAYEVKENPEPVGVLVQKKDASTGNIVANAGFAVFKDQACTQRVCDEKGAELPVFYYDADLGCAASQKFYKKQDTYYVKEVVVPEGYLINPTVYAVSPDYGSFEEVKITNTASRCDVILTKEDSETGKKAQGDAMLTGATYGLYAAENIVNPDQSGIVTYAGNNDIICTKGTEFSSLHNQANAGALLAVAKTDANGQLSFGNLYYGHYYIKEIQPSVGYQLDTETHDLDFTEKGDSHQNISVKMTVEEDIIKQPFAITKISTDAEEEDVDIVEGAEFTVKLLSEVNAVGWDAAATYDVLTTDEDGYAVSEDLPYGKYMVRETKVPEELYKVDDFYVDIVTASEEPQTWLTLNDAPFKAYIRMVKKDAESGETILLSGATFKIYNVKKDAYVTQKVDGKEISEFTTDKTGTVTTPLKLKYGEYQLEEITAPNGYVISEEPVSFTITKTGAVQIFEDEKGAPVIQVEMKDTPVKGSLAITKSGEVLTGIDNESLFSKLAKGKENMAGSEFSYEVDTVSGAAFEVIAAECIYTADHQLEENGERKLAVINGVPATQGAVVATVTTGKDGLAKVEDLPLGKYKIVEVTAPNGFVLNEEPQFVELKYEDAETPVIEEEVEFENERVKTSLSVIKTDGVTNTPVEGAAYAVYTMGDIVITKAGITIASGSAVDFAVTNASGCAVFTADLPLGNYYVKEVVSPEGYVLDTNSYDVDFTYQNQYTAVLKKEIAVKETPIIVQITKTDITTGKELKGAKLTILDREGNEYASWITDGTPYEIHAMPAGEYTLVEESAPYGYMIAEKMDFTVKETGEIQKVKMSDERVKGSIEIKKMDSQSKKPIEGVTFEICDAKGKVLETVTTDKKGIAKTQDYDIFTFDENGDYVSDIPFYAVETKAAQGYELDSTPREVKFSYEGNVTEHLVYNLEVENTPNGEKLPQTGGKYNPWIYVLAGLALAGSGAYVYKKKGKKSNKE